MVLLFNAYPALKSLHIFFVISWFAGLFYLPRLFVNHAMATDAATRNRLAQMEKKLFRFMTPLGILALIFGLWIWLGGYVFSGGWVHGKLAVAAILMIYHIYCGKLMRDLARGTSTRSHVWFRVFNEIPVLLMIAAIILVVYKPF